VVLIRPSTDLPSSPTLSQKPFLSHTETASMPLLVRCIAGDIMILLMLILVHAPCGFYGCE